MNHQRAELLDSNCDADATIALALHLTRPETFTPERLMPFNEKSQTVFLFGAGKGSELWLGKFIAHGRTYFVLDNDERLHGADFIGCKIINPSKLNHFDYREIVVLVSDVTSVINQLLSLGVPQKAITVPAKVDFSSQPLEDYDSRAYGRFCIRKLQKLCSQSGVQSAVDGGTALGLYRDGDLISWDNDIDIALLADSSAKISVLRGKILKTGLFYEAEPTSDSAQLGLFLHSRDGDIPINLALRDTIEGLSISREVSYLTVEADIFWPARQHFIGGETYWMPKQTEVYLRRVYGEVWNQPLKDFSFADYAQRSTSRVVTAPPQTP